MIRRARTSWSLCWLLSSTTAFAAETVVLAEGGPVLQVAPVLCVLEQGQQACPVPVTIQWQASTLAEPICLYRAKQRKAIYCQFEPGNVSLELTEPLADNTRFELRTQAEQKLISAAEAVLARPFAELRPRRRHGWGMF